MTLAIHHVALAARDADAVIAAQTAGAGFRPAGEAGGARWLAGPNAFLAVVPAGDGDSAGSRRVCDPGITHVCVQQSDGRALWDSYAAAGMRFNDAPVALGTGAIYAYGRDAEGNVIEVEGVPDAPADAAPWIAHVALATADIGRLGDFYAALIGRASHREGRFRNNPLFENITGLKDVDVSARWIMADNMIFEMWRYHHPATDGPVPAAGAPGWAHVGFCCADLEAEAARIAAAGITATRTAVFGMTALAGTDPDGNRFVVIEAPAPGAPLSLADLTAPAFVADRNRDLLAR